ncbi:Cytochrome P450 [Tylopilus felleus]
MYRAPEHDIVYTRVFDQDVILLNSEEAAVALLSKRYSDRPEFSPASFFHSKAALDYRDKQLQRAYELLTHLHHFTTFSAAVVMEVTYGYDMKGGETFVSPMQRASDIVLSVGTPELFALCTAFPFVKALPSWFPGMGWKSEAAECCHLVNDGLSAPYAWVKRRLEQGTATPSMVTDTIIRHRLGDDSKDPGLVQAIKDGEQTHATLLVFVYLMLNHPEAQRHAQLEIDHVVGGQRLPDFEDRPSLPYVDAVLRETMRSRPVGPLGIPHATTEDDVYEGCYIPQGATIMANVIEKTEELGNVKWTTGLSMYVTFSWRGAYH